MYILIVALHQPVKPTGVCRHAANLAQCLAETDDVTHVTLIVGKWQQDYFATLYCSEKISLISIEIENRSITRNLWFLFGLPRIVNRLHPDLVHLSFPLPFLKPLFSCPVVSTIHDLYAYECPENFGSTAIFNRSFFKLCLIQSDGLVCVSKTTSESLRRYFPRIICHKPSTVIYNYVDFSNIASKTPRVIPIDSPFLLCVAQHRKNKNLDVLIKAYARLLENTHDNLTNLILVGSPGPETESLNTQVEVLNLGDRVFFLSALEDGELRWLYEHCIIFAIASSTEGFCIPLVEALYFGCKTVCSNIEILKEVGSYTCMYFSLEDDPVVNLSQSFVQALQSTHDFNSCRDERFSKSQTATEFLKFYSEISGKGKSKKLD